MRKLIFIFVAMVLGGCVTEADRRYQMYQAARADTKAYCGQLYWNSELDPIRDKVVIDINLNYLAPFSVLSNKNKPTQAETVIIKKWADAISSCVRYGDKQNERFGKSAPVYVTSAINRINALLVDLYEKKLTYGDFASEVQKVIEVANNERDADRSKKQQQAVQEEEMRQQRLNRNIRLLNEQMKQMQKISNPRQPSLRCKSDKFGDSVTTECYEPE